MTDLHTEIVCLDGQMYASIESSADNPEEYLASTQLVAVRC